MDDVVVVGGRCAGAPTAMLLARAGLRVTLLERSKQLDDVLSGHMIKPAGAARLARWGLLDAVLATGCPPMRVATLWLGDQSFRNPRADDGIPPAVAPRRTTLDPLLLEAARDAGVQVRTGESVTGLIRSGERVAGVTTSRGEYPARLVVGADGRHSRVARLLDAPTYHYVGPVTFAYYTYWRGSAVDELVASLEPGRFIGMFPTNDEQALVFYQAPAAGFSKAKQDPAGNYLAVLRARPQIWEKLAEAEPERRIRGAGDLPNFFRTSAGPGWVLAGDAGHHKDPVIARGIADAFRDADLIAAIAVDAWDGDLDEALAGYPVQRDACARPLSEANVAIARLDQDVADLGRSWLAMNELEASLDAVPAPA